MNAEAYEVSDEGVEASRLSATRSPSSDARGTSVAPAERGRPIPIASTLRTPATLSPAWNGTATSEAMLPLDAMESTFPAASVTNWIVRVRIACPIAQRSSSKPSRTSAYPYWATSQRRSCSTA
jgi:hypothetical protein